MILRNIIPSQSIRPDSAFLKRQLRYVNVGRICLLGERAADTVDLPERCGCGYHYHYCF